MKNKLFIYVIIDSKNEKIGEKIAFIRTLYKNAEVYKYNNNPIIFYKMSEEKKV
jgi:hypothetical protein